MNSKAARDFSDSMIDRSEQSDSLFSEQIDLQHYLRILRKYKWPIVLFTAVVTSLAAYYAYTATPIYRSTSTLLIEENTDGPAPFENLLAGDTINSEYYQTQFELLKSRELAKRVINALDLMDHPELSPSASAEASETGSIEQPVNEANSVNLSTGLDENLAVEEGAGEGLAAVITTVRESAQGLLAKINLGGSASGTDTELTETLETGAVNEISSAEAAQLSADEHERLVIANFSGRLSVTPVRKTKLVKISFESADRDFAATVANAVGEQYILANLDARMADTLKVSTWMGDQIDTLKVRLEDSEQRLLQYRLENGLVEAGGGVTGVQEQQVMLLTQALLSAENDLASAASVRNETRNMRGDFRRLETLPAVQADTIVRDVKLQIGQQQRELDELSTRYGDRHPRIKDAKSQLFSLQSTLEQNINRVVGTIENEFQLASQRVASLRASKAAGESNIQSIGGKTFELDKLQREVSTNQSVYDEFRTRMTEAQSTEGLETPNARISDPAVAAVSPIKPKKSLIILLAALGSLILSALMAFLYEQMDDTVKSAEDVERKIGERMLGILPLLKGGMFGGKQALPLNPLEIKDKKGTFLESINTARTAICLDDNGNYRRVILVTSSVPGEGKSTTSLNLAYSLAQMEKTLLIDCDLRRPTIAKAINLPKNHPGLSSIIAGTAPARECIQRNAIGDLDIICSGPSPDQPLELLSSARFANILNQLGEHYDRIVLDCAPTQAVSDALVLSQLSDAVVYNVKSHDTSIDLVKRGLQRLKQVNAKVAGVLITQVDIDKIVSYGGDYYYQGYYDYYGYNTQGENKANKLEISREEMARINASDERIEYDFGLSGAATANGVAGSDAHMNNGVHTNGNGAHTNGFATDPLDMFDDDLAPSHNGQAVNGDVSDFDRLANGSNQQAMRSAERARNAGRDSRKEDRFADDLDLL